MPDSIGVHALIDALCAECSEADDHKSPRVDALSSGATLPQEVARLLEERGVPTRVVRLERRDLIALQLPTFVFARDTFAPILLLTRRGRRWLCMGTDGLQKWCSQTELQSITTDRALERQPAHAKRHSVSDLIVTELNAHARDILRIAVLGVLGSFLVLAGPWLLRLILDDALPNGDRHGLIALACAVGLVGVQQHIMTWLRERAVHRLEAQLTQANVVELFVRLGRAPFRESTQRPLGKTLAWLSSGEAVAQQVGRILLFPLFDAGSLLCAAGMLAVTAPTLAVVILALCTVVATLCTALTRRAAKVEMHEIEASAKQRAHVYELLSNISVVKGCAAERTVIRKWLDLFLKQRHQALRAQRLSLWRDGASGVGRDLSTLAAFAIVGYQCLEHRLSVGAFVLLCALADQVARGSSSLIQAIGPALSMAQHVRSLGPGFASGCDTPRQTPRRVRSADANAVVLNDVWFRYGLHDPWVLQERSMRVARGEFLQLEGRSGTGKSTLLRLVAGLLLPDRGSISVFGSDPGCVRANLIYLPQASFLFEGSILHNLEMLSGKSRTEVLAAARRTGLAGWLERLPMGTETVLPPGAPNISGGQRQLILLTAAVAAEKELVLLDEATSQIDRVLQSGFDLQELFPNSTVIAVTHEAHVNRATDVRER